MIPPLGRSNVPRFRPVNTRRRAIGVSVAVAVLAGIGAGAWAFGINSESAGSAGCVTQTYVAPPPTSGLVNVYNSTQQTGLATEVAEQLRAKGFQIGQVGNDPERRKIRGTGELRVPAEGAEQQTASLQAWQAGMNVIREQRRSGDSVDYVLGERWQGLYAAPQAPPWIDLPCVPVSQQSPAPATN